MENQKSEPQNLLTWRVLKDLPFTIGEIQGPKNGCDSAVQKSTQDSVENARPG